MALADCPWFWVALFCFGLEPRIWASGSILHHHVSITRLNHLAKGEGRTERDLKDEVVSAQNPRCTRLFWTFVEGAKRGGGSCCIVSVMYHLSHLCWI